MPMRAKYQRSRLHGIHHAFTHHRVFKDDDEVSLIGNAPVIQSHDEADFPDIFKLEIYRLRRRIADLEFTLRDRNERIVKAIKMVEDELAMWRQVMNDDIKETYGAIRRRIGKLEGTLDQLRQQGSKYSPPLGKKKNIN